MNKPKPKLTLRKKILFAGLAVIGCFVVAEVAARLVVAPQDLTHQEHRRTIDVLGLPALNETMEFDSFLFWRLKKDVPGLRIAGKIRNNEIDFAVTTHNHLRSPPVAETKSRYRILAIGDSCTFGLGVNDDQTWPAQLQAKLDREGYQAEVVNAGVPGYTAFQGMRYLHRDGLKLKPDVVVASFGFNDFDLWASRSDVQTARYLALRRWELILVRSRLYLGLRNGIKRLKDPSTGKGMVKVKSKSTGEIQVRRRRLSEGEFEATLQYIKKTCDENDVKLVLMVWPYAEQVSKRSDRPQLYQKNTVAISGENRIPWVDLPHVFVLSRKSLFLDHVHANPNGCRLVADAVYRKLVSELPPANTK